MIAPRILIVRLSALGDSALTLPLLYALKRALPKAHIGWVTEEASASLLRDVPQIDRLHVWKRSEKGFLGARRLAKELRAEGYEASLDAQGLTKSALLPWLAGIPHRIGFRRAPLEARELAPWLNNHLIRPDSSCTHIAARTTFLAQGLGLHPEPHYRGGFAPSPERYESMQAWWKQAGLGAKVLCFGIGTSWPTKIWPPERIAELTRRAADDGYQSLALWGPAEKDALAEWKPLFGPEVTWAPETPSVGDLAALLAHGARYMGPDSAALHLAWLLGKPTFSWFGPSDAHRGAPPSPADAHVVAHPPTRQRTGSMMVGLKTETVLPEWSQWMAAVPDAPAHTP